MPPRAVSRSGRRGRPRGARDALGALTVAVLLATQLASGGGDPKPTHNTWLGADKVKHFFTSFFVQSVSYSALRVAGARPGASLAGATAVSAAVGIAKEVHDRRSYGLLSAGDLVWDAAGIGTASAMLAKVR
ncbi:MAG TPA: hypothetical protein VFJ74_00730 [Gemmatimonadaceae bacterium]|nr:hypothetical protein [Gemmatimonadaceae bacterium]